MESIPDQSAPVLHVDLIGDMANRMIQDMVALNYGVGPQDQEAAHAEIAPFWCLMPEDHSQP